MQGVQGQRLKVRRNEVGLRKQGDGGQGAAGWGWDIVGCAVVGEIKRGWRGAEKDGGWVGGWKLSSDGDRKFNGTCRRVAYVWPVQTEIQLTMLFVMLRKSLG